MQGRLMGLTTLRFGQVLDQALFDPRIPSILAGLPAILPGLLCSKVLNNLLLMVRQLHLNLELRSFPI